jgi:uncharacterized membrane protein YfcA
MNAFLSFAEIVFVAGAFAAALITSLSGFAFGMVAAAIWLHVLAPAQTTALIVINALIVQSYAVWKIRRSVKASRLAPFVAGSAIGIPVGFALLTWTTPAKLRFGVGLLLIAFSVFNLTHPKMPVVKRFVRPLDSTTGVLNGILGAATGLAGVLVMIWCNVRGWPRDEQRAVFQPTAIATFAMTIAWMSSAGSLTTEIGRLFLIGLPAVAAGTWLGWKLYGQIDDGSFRKIVMGLLLASGATLVVNAL